MNSTIITSIDCRLFRVPLREAMSDAKHGAHTHFELVTVTLQPPTAARAPATPIRAARAGARSRRSSTSSRAIPVGKDAAEIAQIYDGMLWHIHYVGRGGIAAFAISACDIALWDLKGRRENHPLWRMVGGAGRTAKAYRGGIDLNLPLERLLQSVAGYLDGRLQRGEDQGRSAGP